MAKDKPNTRYVAFQGKAGWSHLDRPDTKYTPDGKWSQQITLTGDAYTKLLELKGEGLKNTIKPSEDGYIVTFSRPTQKLYQGKLTAFLPPLLEDKDGIPLKRDFRFGHGSDITVTVEVYYTRPRPNADYNANARLASVRIDNLVPYSRDDYDIKEQRAAKATDKLQPVPSQAW